MLILEPIATDHAYEMLHDLAPMLNGREIAQLCKALKLDGAATRAILDRWLDAEMDADPHGTASIDNREHFTDYYHGPRFATVATTPQGREIERMIAKLIDGVNSSDLGKADGDIFAAALDEISYRRRASRA